MNYFTFIQKNLLAAALLIFSVTAAAAQQTAESVPTPTPLPQVNSNLPQNAPEIAPDYVAPVRPLPPADRVGIDIANQKLLPLSEAIKMALQNNNDIEASETSVRMAQFNVKAAAGRYDPRLAGESSYLYSKVPNASSFGSASGSNTTKTFSNSVGIEGQSPFAGGNYSARLLTSRDDSDNPLNTLNPLYPSAMSFQYSQPLLQGLKIDDTRRSIKIAKKNVELTDEQFRNNSIITVTNVVQAYWDLTYALKNLQVQIDAVNQARLQVESNNRQVAEGTIAPIEAVEAEAQVTFFEQQVYTAQETVTAFENHLKTMILPNSNDPNWTQALVPTTPVNIEPPKVTVEQALTEAKSNRSELAQLQLSKDINKINTDYLKDQTRPQIDLVAGFTTNGLAGGLLPGSGGGIFSAFEPLFDRVNVLSNLANLPPIPFNNTSSAPPANLVGGYGQSFRNLFRMDYPTYQFGVRINLPIGNRTAKANLGYSLAEATQIDNQIAQQEQLVKADVQNALQSMVAAQARLNSAAASRNSNELLYESERRKLENGTSTVYLVLQRQQNLVSARGRELQAQVDLNKSIANFHRAVGSTLEAHQIEVKDTDAEKRLDISSAAPADTDQYGHSRTMPRVAPGLDSKTQFRKLD